MMGHAALSREDMASAHRTAAKLNEYYNNLGKPINARVCPRTATVISDLSKAEAIPSHFTPREKKKPDIINRPITSLVQDHLAAHPQVWLRTEYIATSIGRSKSATAHALTALVEAGIVLCRKRPFNERIIEYTIVKGASK